MEVILINDVDTLGFAEDVVKVNVNCGRNCQWVVITDSIDESSVSSCSAVCYYDVVIRSFASTVSL